MQLPKGMIFDIDGVMQYQGKVYPGAIDTIQWLRNRGLRLCFLTNSTLKSRASAAEKLRRVGFLISQEEVVTASSATAAYLRQVHPQSCWVMLEREGLDEFREFNQTTDDPEWLVVGDNRSHFDFDTLNHALRVLVNGARLIGMQSDLIDSSMGSLELNVGSWVGMLERASGVQAIYIGKPHAYAFELAMQLLKLEKEDVMMIGDRVSTDVQGAHSFGIRSLLVRTGEFDANDLNGNIQPDLICDSIWDIPKAFWTS